jgi:hypothetical protein
MIFKKGEKSEPSNYRPIALENSTFKLFTNILNKRLSNGPMRKILYQNSRMDSELKEDARIIFLL